MADAPSVLRPVADAMTARISSSVEAALHQQICLAFMDQLHRTGGGCLAMGRINQLESPNGEIMLPSNGPDPLGGSDEHRDEQSVFDCLNDTAQRAFVTWVHHRTPHCWNLLGEINQLIIFDDAVTCATALYGDFSSGATLGSAANSKPRHLASVRDIRGCRFRHFDLDQMKRKVAKKPWDWTIFPQ
jgi:hypothetical protein